jgi:hypothetical protein
MRLCFIFCDLKQAHAFCYCYVEQKVSTRVELLANQITSVPEQLREVVVTCKQGATTVTSAQLRFLLTFRSVWLHACFFFLCFLIKFGLLCLIWFFGCCFNRFLLEPTTTTNLNPEWNKVFSKFTPRLIRHFTVQNCNCEIFLKKLFGCLFVCFRSPSLVN